MTTARRLDVSTKHSSPPAAPSSSLLHAPHHLVPSSFLLARAPVSRDLTGGPPRIARRCVACRSERTRGGGGGGGGGTGGGGDAAATTPSAGPAKAAAAGAAAAPSADSSSTTNQDTVNNINTQDLPPKPAPPPARRMAAPSAAGAAALAASPCAVVAGAVVPPQAPNQPAFRYWIDELLWSQGHVACETLEELLLRMGGERAGGPPKASIPRGAAAALPPPPPPSDSSGNGAPRPTAGGSGPVHPLERYLGCQHVQEWDFLWSKSVYALRAARAMRPAGGAGLEGGGGGDGVGPPTATTRPRPPGVVSAVAGLNCLTMKKRLVRALRLAYGERAWRLTPRSFELPEELPRWREWVVVQRALRRALLAAAPLRQQRQQDEGGGEGGGGGGGAAGREEGAAAGAAAAAAASSAAAAATAAADSSSDLWILKTGQDAGKGLSLLPAERALAAAAAHAAAQQVSALAASSSSRARAPPPSTTHAQQQAQRRLLKVAQLYVRDPLLVRGRKFHLRLWVLVTGARPLRAFLHDEGLVLFSSEPYEDLPVGFDGGGGGGGAAGEGGEKGPDAGQQLEGGGGGGGAGGSRGRAKSTSAAAAAASTSSSSSLLPPPPASHVTNFARNEGTWVWTLDDLARELGPTPWRQLRGRIARNAAAVVAAALPSALDAHRWLGPPPVEHYGFQIVGFDYLIDSRMRPWLLEVNSAPSIMAVHSDAAVAMLVRAAKQAALCAALEMARPRFDASFAPAPSLADAAAAGPSSSSSPLADDGPASSSSSSSCWRALADHEMRARAGFRPLAPLFASCGARVAWAPRDAELWRRLEEVHGSTVASEWPEVAELEGEWEEEEEEEGGDGSGDDDDDNDDDS